jgi:hypothetical protein
MSYVKFPLPKGIRLPDYRITPHSVSKLVTVPHGSEKDDS